MGRSPQPAQSVNAPVPVDAAIIGGGVAGSALALTLRRLGLDVGLIEREPRFRDRVRGEYIHPWGAGEIAALGLRPILDAAGAVALPRWTRYRDAVAADPYSWTDDFPDSPGALGIGHPRLQDALLAAARDEGVRVFRPATAHPVRSSDGWEIAVTGDEDNACLTTPLLVGADGQRSAVRGLIGGTATRDPVHHAIGGLLVGGAVLARDSVHQAYHAAGFGLVFPQQDDLARAYYICPSDEARGLQLAGPGAFIARLREIYPPEMFAAATPAGPMAFFPNADVVSDRFAAPGAILVGDAASSNDPCQGHGLSLVFRDIRTVRDLIAAGTSLAHLPGPYANERARYYGVLREHARWSAPLATDTGTRADELRAQVDHARQVDPSAGGFAALFATGPDGLAIDDRARAHFFGEDLPNATVFGAPW
jgi:2-polyprenyl-6-methoxyphenol hydroxylase-like FAD-dependent oxidoreductase